MNKKIFGIRIGTIISLLVCVLVAFAIWLYANYTHMTDESVLNSAFPLIFRG
jgi:hypothetical protein